MSNSAKKSRDRRRFEKSGGKTLPALPISDFSTWTEILVEWDVIPPWQTKKPSVDAVWKATQKMINDWCSEFRREKAEEMLANVATAKTGLIEREPPPDPESKLEPAHAMSTRFSEGGHWSFRPGKMKDKGRVYTQAEMEEYLEVHPELADAIGNSDDTPPTAGNDDGFDDAEEFEDGGGFEDENVTG